MAGAAELEQGADEIDGGARGATSREGAVRRAHAAQTRLAALIGVLGPVV